MMHGPPPPSLTTSSFLFFCTFCRYREDLNEGYDTTIHMLTSATSDKGGRRAVEWKTRMGRRIVEADADQESRKCQRLS